MSHERARALSPHNISFINKILPCHCFQWPSRASTSFYSFLFCVLYFFVFLLLPPLRIRAINLFDSFYGDFFFFLVFVVAAASLSYVCLSVCLSVCPVFALFLPLIFIWFIADYGSPWYIAVSHSRRLASKLFFTAYRLCRSITL